MMAIINTASTTNTAIDTMIGSTVRPSVMNSVLLEVIPKGVVDVLSSVGGGDKNKSKTSNQL